MGANNQHGTSQDRFKEKFVIYLNAALAMENSAADRIQRRVKEVSGLPETRRRLEHHLQETKEQQNRLINLISGMGGKPTDKSAELPIISFPDSLSKDMAGVMSDEEWQLKKAEEDFIIENAEVACYNSLLQLAMLAKTGDMIPVITQNLQEEESMAAWLKSNMPAIVAQLWPRILESTNKFEKATSS